jgi:hypothetical protein
MRMATPKTIGRRLNGHRYLEVFEPDVILPAQFAVLRGLPAQGERALLLAVLEMALRDLELFAGRKALLETPAELLRLSFGFRARYWKRHREREALMAWFRSNSTAHAFTFVSICEAFNLHPDAIRRKLEQRGWVPARAPTHLHATAQHPRQLHGGYRSGQ